MVTGDQTGGMDDHGQQVVIEGQMGEMTSHGQQVVMGDQMGSGHTVDENGQILDANGQLSLIHI